MDLIDSHTRNCLRPPKVLAKGSFSEKEALEKSIKAKHEQDLQTTHVAGTLGYIAPELARSGKPTPSTDVYAFRGILPGAFWMEGKILSTMDPKLDQEWKAEEAELVLKLGLLCSHGVAEGRPRMSQVLIYLKGQAALPENLNAHVRAQEGRGESEKSCHFVLLYTISNNHQFPHFCGSLSVVVGICMFLSESQV
ncbi:hypothetical protein OIU79_009697 [Salix purpurea]|uniref:Uncharacterized protein n=1 Tax=Salix purpurea TaxID=77065 RepID=A0A9Q0QDW4_SALPP|nr:hypothetical protein OIU79_009697 [Salix purpurea]